MKSQAKLSLNYVQGTGTRGTELWIYDQVTCVKIILCHLFRTRMWKTELCIWPTRRRRLTLIHRLHNVDSNMLSLILPIMQSGRIWGYVSRHFVSYSDVNGPRLCPFPFTPIVSYLSFHFIVVHISMFCVKLTAMYV